MLRAAAGRAGRAWNGLGSRKRCLVCGRSFHHFTRFGKGAAGRSDFRRRLDIVGSDLDNFGCPYCGCHDRERHLIMFFDKLGIWQRMKGARILHFAPEKHLPERIRAQAPAEYLKADLAPARSDIERIDATSLPFADGSYDVVIANHVLEHIPDYARALSEFFRVLRPGGFAVLQTPYSKLLQENFADAGIDSDELRLFFHGQEDHVRTFGRPRFLQSLSAAGFVLRIARHDDLFDARAGFYYGVNREEDLILVDKPET
jgi:hypothetical protein